MIGAIALALLGPSASLGQLSSEVPSERTREPGVTSRLRRADETSGLDVRVIVGGDFVFYRPGIDDGLGGATPYADLFGDGRGPLLGGYLGVALPLVPDLTLTFTAAVSHFGDSAYAFVDDGGDGVLASGDARSGGETSFDATPIALRAGVRLTTLASRLRVPLILFAEGGLAYAPWVIGRGDGSTAASGSTPGLVGTAGLLVELAGLEARSARALEEDVGITSVVLRAGITRWWLDGFGAADALVLSDTAWSFGLELGF